MHHQNLERRFEKRALHPPGFIFPIKPLTHEGCLMTDILEICKIHQIPLSEVGKKKILRCKNCSNEKKKIWASNNKNLIRLQKQRSRKRRYEWLLRDRKDNPEKYKEYAKKGWGINGITYMKKNICNKYNITLQEYDDLILNQKNVCAICCKSETRKSSNSDNITRLSIDHCHKSGIVRALLCYRCNILLGKAKDSIELLKQAILYLEKHAYN